MRDKIFKIYLKRKDGTGQNIAIGECYKEEDAIALIQNAINRMSNQQVPMSAIIDFSYQDKFPF